MPINKFTTLLDLARQAKIITGETATFDGKIQVGIPFSGYPTGVDTGTTVSLGVVSSEDAVFSGNSGTTIFDVANTGSTNYSPIFSGYSGSVWTNVLFSGNTSGLTLPITPLSADTQVVGPFWTLTQTGMTGDYVIGTQYTGYSVTYSFFNVSQLGTGFTYSGFTTASQENFSAGTLDYKGPLDYISTKEDASVEGRLTTNKLTVTGGASSATTGYVLTQTGDTGEVGWVFNSASGTTDTNLANSNLTQSTGTRFYQLPAGYRLAFSDRNGDTMLQFNESDPSVVVNNGLNSTDFQVKGQTDLNTFYVDVATDSVGIGTSTPTEKLVVDGNVKIIGNSGAVTRSLTIGDDDEITFITLGSSVTDNIIINSQQTSGKINLKNGTIDDRFTELAQYSTYGAISFNVGYTGSSTAFIVNDSISGTTSFRVGDEDTLSDVMYLFGKKSEDKLGPFTGVTDSKVVYAKEFLSVAENLSVSNVPSAVGTANLFLDSDDILTIATSDERLKENITPLSGSLETILNINGVSYNAINKKISGEEKFYGFIAQQVDSVDSNLTFTNKSDGYMGIKHDNILPLLVESIKEIHNNPSIPNYTPSSSGDTYGSVGNVTIDDDYLYVKTNSGWKRTTLESF